MCEAARLSARFSAPFCPQGDIRGKEFLSRDCAQKWVPPKAWRFCDTLYSMAVQKCKRRAGRDGRNRVRKNCAKAEKERLIFV